MSPYGAIFEKGQEVKGKRVATKDRWLKFDGCKWHSVTPTVPEKEGQEVRSLSLVFFNPRRMNVLKPQDWDALEEAGYPCSTMRREILEGGSMVQAKLMELEEVRGVEEAKPEENKLEKDN
eukprot:1298839-Amphidinium_carterae.3